MKRIKINKMKKLLTLVFVFLLVFEAYSQNKKTNNAAIVHLNQLGYYPKSVKKAIVVESKVSTFEIVNAKGKSVYKGVMSKPTFYDQSGENVQVADFSDFIAHGIFTFKVSDTKESCKFEIKPNIYKDAFIAVLKSFYYQRSGQDIDEKYAGQWSRPKGHPDTLCYFHPSSQRGNGTMMSSKGWYDAGDYNKYVVNGGVSVGTMLNFFEMYPTFVTDGMTNIPESENGKSDLLDEIKYELDWMISMQMPDGASNMKLTSKNFSGFIMPVDDTTSRFVVGKSTAATLNLAAITAQASRLYKTYDNQFAAKCFTASEKAWEWAVKNPKAAFKNPGDINTGEYGDSIFTEEFWWAASELYAATHKTEYLNYMLKNEPYVDMFIGNSWCNFVGNLGCFSILLSDANLSKDLKLKMNQKLVDLANVLLTKLEKNPYRTILSDYQWGSNSDILNSAIIFAYAYQLSNDGKYLNAIVESVDYIFGKNATGYSFVTGFGSKTPQNIHHRLSGADKIVEPIPGFVVGGPNGGKQDTGIGVKYESEFPAKSYIDVEESYASNEVCINWNAPAVFILGFLEANADRLK